MQTQNSNYKVRLEYETTSFRFIWYAFGRYGQTHYNFIHKTSTVKWVNKMRKCANVYIVSSKQQTHTYTHKNIIIWILKKWCLLVDVWLGPRANFSMFMVMTLDWRVPVHEWQLKGVNVTRMFTQRRRQRHNDDSEKENKCNVIY